MKRLLILAWCLRCFVKLDLVAFEGSSDQWIFMIFGCAILHYFTVFFYLFYFTASACITGCLCCNC